VGEALEGMCLKASVCFSHAIENIGLFKPEGTVVLHILRGAAGYRVVDSLRVRVPVLSIRTEYQGDAYRAHSDGSRNLSVTYKNYPVDLELSRISNVIIPDTYATGRSAEAALQELFAAGLEPSQIILYGFIAIPALERIGNICKEKGIKMHSFAICNLTQLASNYYDMPIYGLDESLYASKRRIRKLGSIIAKKTFLGILPKYIAGMDQPGDWSERQVSLFNGQGNEAGDIKGHLKKSLNLIESLKSLNSTQKWYNDIHEEISNKEIKSIEKVLIDYNN
jgi:uracil phosphoribosyltransferase